MAQVDEIELKVWETATIKVPRVAYLQAKEAGMTAYFLDQYLSDMSSDVVIEEPDGKTHNPYWVVD